MGTYTKLDNTILHSSIWCADSDTRIVWITMLAMSDFQGVVESSVPGLARIANVSVEACERALEYLESPDEASRSREYEGRRIKRIDGGFLILNKEKYRDKQYSRAEYMREWRKGKKGRKARNTFVTDCHSCATVTHTETETETETETKGGAPPTPPAPSTISSLPVKSLSEQIRADRAFGKCCTLCGSSSKADSGRMIWREHLPWCGLYCYDKWVAQKNAAQKHNANEGEPQ
jgi:hypothetical protein